MRFYTLAVAWIVLAIIIAHLLVPSPYRWTQNTIAKEQFMEWTKSVWTINPESAQKVGHPAPFPVELPYRLIQLYTFQGDMILDPFMGSGTTAIAALQAGRKYVGYENNLEYVKLAAERIATYEIQAR